MKFVPQIPIKAKLLSVILLALWIFSVLGLKWGLGPSLSFLNIVSSVVLLCAIYCLFRKKESALSLVKSFLVLSTIIFMENIFKFGIYDELLRMFVFGVLLSGAVFLGRDKFIREQYVVSEKSKRQDKIEDWICAGGVVLLLIVSLFIITYLNIKVWPKSQPINKRLMSSNSVLPQDQYRIERHWGWDVPIPKTFINNKDQGEGIIRTYFNDDKTEGMIVDSSPTLFDAFYQSMPFLRKFSGYEILQKIHYENIGIVYRTMGALTCGETSYDLHIGDLKGFEDVHLNKEGNADVVILFRDGHHFIQIVFISKTGKLPHDQIEDILSHVKYVGESEYVHGNH